MKRTPAKSKPTWLFAAATGLAVLAYVFFVFLPGMQATAALRTELQEKQQYVVRCAKTGEQIRAAEQELGRTNDYVATWRDASPHEARVAHVFVEVTEHAEHAGADIVRLEPQPVERWQFMERVPVEMSCEGSYAQLFTFMAKLESLAPDFWVTKMHLQPVAAGGTRLRCELSLVFFADQRKIYD